MDKSNRLTINQHVSIGLDEIKFDAIRAQGAGGQHVNKTSTAIHLRFDINASTLPDTAKTKLMALRDQRVTADGVIIIKAQAFRSQERNRQHALERLADIIRAALVPQKTRKATKPTKTAVRKRLDQKTKRAATKNQRRRPSLD